MDLFRSTAFADHVDHLMTHYHVPGLAIALVQNVTTASKGYGFATVRDNRTCTPDTLFDIASASKSLTAASVALLVQDNGKYPQLQYETTISSLLPDDFVMAEDSFTDQVTVEDILSHRTGLPRHDNSYLGSRAKYPDDAKSVTRNLRNLQISAPLRSRFIYCNIMYTVAAFLIEKMTNLGLADFLNEHFFKPLGMESTNLQPARARAAGLSDRIASGHVWNDQQRTYRSFQPADAPEAEGAGSIITSANDYIKFVSAVMHQEYPFTDRLCQGLLKPRILENPDQQKLEPLTSMTAYATGWEVVYYRGHKIVLHDGLVAGFSSRIFFLPAHRFGGVMFANSEDGSDVANILSHELFDEILGVPLNDRPDWQKVVQDEDSGNDDDNEDEYKHLRERLCPGINGSQPQRVPLHAYTGTFINPGYHEMLVEIRDDKLYIDASDRSMGFTQVFDHVCTQTQYIVHLVDVVDGEENLLAGEFKFDNDQVVKMGLQLEDDLPGLVWFARVERRPDRVLVQQPGKVDTSVA